MRLLIDTSAWIEHLKGNSAIVREVLFNENIIVLTHSSALAELVLGGVKGTLKYSCS